MRRLSVHALSDGERRAASGELPTKEANVKSIEELQAEVKGLVEERDRLKILLTEANRQQEATERRCTEAFDALEKSTVKLTESEPLITDGQQYRADLVAEITRLGGVLGAEREATVVASSLAKAGVASLKEVRDEYQKRVDERFPPQPVGQAAPPAKDGETVDERPIDRGAYAVI
jgi:hypothetical protein